MPYCNVISFCRRSSIRCERGGAARRPLGWIITSGLRLDWTKIGLPYRDVWKRSHAEPTARRLRSMLAFLDSVSVSDLPANTIGCECNTKTAPKHFCKLSTCSTRTVYCRWKVCPCLYRSKPGLLSCTLAIWWWRSNDSAWWGNQTHSVSCLRSSCRTTEWYDRLARRMPCA